MRKITQTTPTFHAFSRCACVVIQNEFYNNDGFYNTVNVRTDHLTQTSEKFQRQKQKEACDTAKEILRKIKQLTINTFNSCPWRSKICAYSSNTWRAEEGRRGGLFLHTNFKIKHLCFICCIGRVE